MVDISYDKNALENRVGKSSSKHKPVTPPFVRNPYNYDTMTASDEAGLFCPEKTLTQQHSKDECDINQILEKMARGIMPDHARTPQYGDFTSSANDYHDALNTVIAAQTAFDNLPAKLRARFNNDPENLLVFLQDNKNLSEARELGLVAAEDLSIPPPDAHTGGKAGGGVEKSGKAPKDAPRTSKTSSQGDEGDD